MKQNPFKEETLPAGLGKILVAHLIPDKKNPRKDLKKGDLEFEKISKSVEKFGQLDPIIFNTRTRKVIGGHQRLKVLDSKGYTELYTVTLGAYTWAFAEADLKELTDKEESAANIALNKAQGDWAMDQLTANLQELKLEGLLDVTGFDDKEFDAMIRELHKDDEPQDSEPQISRAEELRKEWGTELGQLWQCGEHRVLCGDCTDPAVVARVMQGEKADMVFTDPPYNIDYQDMRKKHAKIKNDDRSEFDFKKFLSAALKGIPETSYVCCNWMTYPIFLSVLEAIERPVKSCIVWDKETRAQNLDKYYKQHEFVLYTGKLGGEKTLRGDVWRIQRGKSDMHPTMKPVELVVMAIEDNPDSEVVLDPFLGSGTTMIACENLGRRCRACEIDPGYVAVELQRYKDTFPGKEIRLIADNSGA